MKVLALDTSTKEASVAVVENNILLGEYTLNHNKTHSQNLVPMINDLLLNLGLEAKDIDMFAVSIGPGSFTGLRIGVVTAKALAYALDKAIIGIPTLDVLAYNIPFCQNIICPIIDARNNRVYTALYKWTLDKKERFTKYMAIRIDELAQILKESTRDSEQKVIFLGDGLKAYRSFFLDELGETSVFAPHNLSLKRGSSLGEMALEFPYKTDKKNSFTLVPFYLSKSQAERKKDAEESN